MEANDELKEQAEKAHGPFDRKVGASMAIFAALLAFVTVSGHISATEELLAQQKASDQWAFYQAKSLRRYESEIARDVLAAIGGATSVELRGKYLASLERYQSEGDGIQADARELERESLRSGRRALRLHVGEVFLEMALVLASLAILTKRGALWAAGLASSAAGAVIAATVLAVH